LKSGLIIQVKYLTEMNNYRLNIDFYTRDVLDVAPDLIGKYLVIRLGDDDPIKYMITETEAYRGWEDKACHASRGETARNKIMFERGGKIYVYFIYGMHWMFNIVTGSEGIPQAALIRGIEGFNGPGKLTKVLGINRSYYGEDLTTSDRIWVEGNDYTPLIKSSPRIGVDYAGEYWKNKPWRYYI